MVILLRDWGDNAYVKMIVWKKHALIGTSYEDT